MGEEFSEGSKKGRHVSTVETGDKVCGINEGHVCECEFAGTEPTAVVLETRMQTSVIMGNIRGLNPGQNYSKIEYLRDLAAGNNHIVITLTESHLHEGVSDYEIQLDGWTVHRSDRLKRQGRGIVTYVRDNMIVSRERRFSDGISEILCVYIHKLNLGLITVY